MATKELLEVVDLGLGVVDAVKAIKADGKVDLQDLPAVLKLAPLLGPAFDGIDQVPSELSSLSSEEAADVIAHVMVKLSVDNPKAKALVEKSLKAMAALYDLVKEVKA